MNYTVHDNTARDVSEGKAKLNAAGTEEDPGNDPFASTDEMENDKTVTDHEWTSTL